MKAITNQSFEFLLNEDVAWECVEVKEGSFHLILNNKSYVADVVNCNFSNKSFDIQINNHVYTVVLKDKYDDLLEQLGMSSGSVKLDKEVKAPMPGRVLELLVEVGETVKEGGGLLVLEAMKMENIIKSPCEGIIKAIVVKQENNVDKNAILVVFE